MNSAHSQDPLDGGYLKSCSELEGHIAKMNCSNEIIMKSIREDEASVRLIDKAGIFSVAYSVFSSGELRVGAVIPFPQRIYSKSIEEPIKKLLLKHLNKFEWKHPQQDGEFATAVEGNIRIDTDKL